MHLIYKLFMGVCGSLCSLITLAMGEQLFDFNGLDMGDLQRMKGAINQAMTHARRARREWETLE